MTRQGIPIDYFEEAKSRVREDGADIPLLRKIAALQAEMEARGIKPDDMRIPAYMAALDPPESKRQLAITGQSLGHTLPADPLLPEPRDERLLDRLSRTLRRWRAQAQWAARQTARNWKQILRRVAPYLALLALVAALVWIFWPVPIEPNPEDKKGGIVSRPPVDPGPVTPPQLESRLNPDFYLWLGAIWIAAFGIWLLFQLWRRQVLQRESNPDMGPVINLSLNLGRASLFSGPSAERVWRQLRLRRPVASSRVDIRASLKATLAQAGYPVIRFDMRRVRPEYLIFSEREMPNDHLPEVARALYAQMAARQIDAMHYEYQDAPNRLRLDRTVGKAISERGFETLASVLARHEGARALVSMESFDAVTAGGAAPSWLGRLSEQHRPFLLNPRARRHWGLEEDLLAEHALPSVPASTEGLRSFARQVTADNIIPPQTISAKHPDADLPAFFAAEREWLVAAYVLDARQHEPVIDNLLIWLSPHEMTWLRTLALFPVIHRAFTHFSAMALFGKEGSASVDFLKIARLPWFRVGYMPDWLREPLAQGMTPQQLDDAKAAVQAFFATNEVPCVDAQEIFQLRLTQQKPKKREQFRERMKHSSLPALTDNLLRSAFENRDPMELTIAPIAAASRRWHSRPELLAPAAALLASVALPWMVGPTREVEVQVAEPPADPEPNPPPPTTPATTETLPTSETPTPTPTSTQTPPVKPDRSSLVVYVHIASDAEIGAGEKFISDLRGSRISGRPIAPTTLEVRSNSPSSTDVRCFSDEQCALAPELQAVVQRLLGTPVRQQRLSSFSGSAGLEIWVAKNDLKDYRPPVLPPPDTLPNSLLPQACNRGPYIVYFDWDGSNLSPEAIPILENAASAYLSACQGAIIKIAGHTDRSGSADYNIGLSERRANSAESYLEEQRLRSGTMRIEAFGESQNRVPTKDGVRNPQNRRVEITFEPVPSAN